MTLTQAYFILAAAIVCEIVATGSLKATDGFTKLYPSITSLFFVCICMYLMSLVMKILPIGITYATWSGIGIVAISIIGFFKYKQIPNFPTLIGLILIIAGCIIVNTMNDLK